MSVKLPTEDDEEYADTHMEGYLEKQAHDNPKKFQKRWFSTLNEYLCYAQTKGGAPMARKAVDIRDAEKIFLSSIRIVNVKLEDRSLKLRASDPLVAKEWVKALCNRRRHMLSATTRDHIEAAAERVRSKGGSSKRVVNPYAPRTPTRPKKLSIKEKLAAMEARMEKKLLERGISPRAGPRSNVPSSAKARSGAGIAGFRSQDSSASATPAGSAVRIKQSSSMPARATADESNPFGSEDDDDDDYVAIEPVDVGYPSGSAADVPAATYDDFGSGGDDSDVVGVPYAEPNEPNLSVHNSDLHLLDASLYSQDSTQRSPSPSPESNPFADEDEDAEANPFGDDSPQHEAGEVNPFGDDEAETPNPFGSSEVETPNPFPADDTEDNAADATNPFADEEEEEDAPNPFGDDGTSSTPVSRWTFVGARRVSSCHRGHRSLIVARSCECYPPSGGAVAGSSNFGGIRRRRQPIRRRRYTNTSWRR